MSLKTLKKLRKKKNNLYSERKKSTFTSIVKVFFIIFLFEKVFLQN